LLTGIASATAGTIGGRHCPSELIFFCSLPLVLGAEAFGHMVAFAEPAMASAVLVS